MIVSLRHHIPQFQLQSVITIKPKATDFRMDTTLLFSTLLRCHFKEVEHFPNANLHISFQGLSEVVAPALLPHHKFACPPCFYFTRELIKTTSLKCGPGSVVGIVTRYGLDGPGIESRWRARFSAPVQTGSGAHPAFCTMGNRSFPGVKSGRGVTLTPHPLLVPWSRKDRAIPLFPCGPYDLYRVSVPVQGCPLPLLPLNMSSIQAKI
jgi:hypothetical protein